MFVCQHHTTDMCSTQHAPHNSLKVFHTILFSFYLIFFIVSDVLYIRYNVDKIGDVRDYCSLQ